MNPTHLIELQETLSEMRLTPTRAACLEFMRQEEETGIPLPRMAELLGLTPSGARAAIRLLELDGYLQRRVERTDKRGNLYKVTDSGKRALETIEKL